MMRILVIVLLAMMSAASVPTNRTLISLEEQQLRNISSISSLFMIVIRFMGSIAFEPQHNPTAAIRCEIFSRITLPALIAATNNAPPRTKMKIVFINASAVLEPTCARVVNKARNQLGRRLYFSASNSTYMEHTDMDHDLLFFARLDTDDSFGPDVLPEIHRQFLQSQLPIAVLSPFYGNLWYPTAGDSDCGDIIYNINIARSAFLRPPSPARCTTPHHVASHCPSLPLYVSAGTR